MVSCAVATLGWVDDASPLTRSGEDSSAGERKATGRGAHADLSMRRDARMQPTHINYGELR